MAQPVTTSSSLTLERLRGRLDLLLKLVHFALGGLRLGHRLLKLLVLLFEKLLGRFQVGFGLLQLVLRRLEPLAPLLGKVPDFALEALNAARGAAERGKAR
jgi:hypothetical protein